MKKLALILAVALFAVAGSVSADRYVYTASYTGFATTYSDWIPVSGWLDKIEISQTASRTCDVIVATYTATGANGSAIETFAACYGLAGSKVVRPRVYGTSTAGAALTVTSTTTATYYESIITIPYERAMVSGNVAIKIQGSNLVAASTNDIVIGIIYEPTKK